MAFDDPSQPISQQAELALAVGRLRRDAKTGKAGGRSGNRLEIRDLERAFRSLPEAQSEALWLVGVGGFSYQDAAKIGGCPEGTVKSRANRGRIELDRRLASEASNTRSARVERLCTDLA